MAEKRRQHSHRGVTETESEVSLACQHGAGGTRQGRQGGGASKAGGRRQTAAGWAATQAACRPASCGSWEAAGSKIIWRRVTRPLAAPTPPSDCESATPACMPERPEVCSSEVSCALAAPKSMPDGCHRHHTRHSCAYHGVEFSCVMAAPNSGPLALSTRATGSRMRAGSPQPRRSKHQKCYAAGSVRCTSTANTNRMPCRHALTLSWHVGSPCLVTQTPTHPPAHPHPHTHTPTHPHTQAVVRGGHDQGSQVRRRRHAPPAADSS